MGKLKQMGLSERKEEKSEKKGLSDYMAWFSTFGISGTQHTSEDNCEIEEMPPRTLQL